MVKGQLTALVGIMIFVTIIVLALAIAPASKQFTDGARNETSAISEQGLNCTSTLLSDYDKGACVLVDLITPTFIIVLICIGGIIFGAKMIIESVA